MEVLITIQIRTKMKAKIEVKIYLGMKLKEFQENKFQQLLKTYLKKIQEKTILPLS